VPVNDRIVRTQEGQEYVIEAWRVSAGGFENWSILVAVLALLKPWWTIGVKRFPVTLGSRPLYAERTLGAGAAQRRVDVLAREIEAGRIPRKR